MAVTRRRVRINNLFERHFQFFTVFICQPSRVAQCYADIDGFAGLITLSSFGWVTPGRAGNGLPNPPARRRGRKHDIVAFRHIQLEQETIIFSDRWWRNTCYAAPGPVHDQRQGLRWSGHNQRLPAAVGVAAAKDAAYQTVHSAGVNPPLLVQ